jgi:hypothetical protein
MGMTLAEVHAILGGPPRDESNGPPDLDEPGEMMDLLHEMRLRQWVDCAVQADFDSEGGGRSSWQSDRVAVYVWWGAARTVESCHVFLLRRAPESPLALVRRLLGL